MGRLGDDCHVSLVEGDSRIMYNIYRSIASIAFGCLAIYMATRIIWHFVIHPRRIKGSHHLSHQLAGGGGAGVPAAATGGNTGGHYINNDDGGDDSKGPVGSGKGGTGAAYAIPIGSNATNQQHNRGRSSSNSNACTTFRSQGSLFVVWMLCLTTATMSGLWATDPFGTDWWSSEGVAFLAYYSAWCHATACGIIVRLFLRVHSRFHAPSRRMVKPFDYFLAAFVIIFAIAEAFKVYYNNMMTRKRMENGEALVENAGIELFGSVFLVYH
jgi:hypothetical protein